MRALEREKILSKRERPWGFWKTEEGLSEIRECAMDFFQREGSITVTVLKEKNPRLLYLILNNYGGCMSQLRLDLEIAGRKSSDYWTKDRTIAQARKFVEEHGGLSHSLLERSKMGSLVVGIRRYEGGINQLKKDLGIETKRKPKGYWTPQRIRETAKAFYESNGRLDQGILRKKGEISLSSVISRAYPGGLHKLRRDLGIETKRHPRGFWTKERIEDEALRIFRKKGKLTTYPMTTFMTIVYKHYPGGIEALRRNVGIRLEISSDEANRYASRLVK